MRYYTYGVGAHLVNELDIAGAVDEIIHDGRDIIHIRLIDETTLMIHLIDSPIPLYEIKNTVSANTAAGDHTLFILWSDMLLPDHGRIVELEDWHEALLALHGDQIYAYKIYMQRLFIFPIYFESIPYSAMRRIHYGDPIDVGGLRCRAVDVSVGPLAGTFRVAAFDGDPDAYHRRRAARRDPVPPSKLARFYAVLGLEPDADRAAIKTAFRELARQHHPDRSRDDDANNRMQEINIAYETIIRALDENGR
ncbi:MAG: J domain-containing protein [Chloroflexota bacterium]